MTVTTAGLTAASKTPFIITFGGNQSVQFVQHWDYSTDQAAALAVGDLDGDGRPDVVSLAQFSGGNGTSVGGFLLLRNTSTPGVLDSTSLGPPQPLIAN